MNHVERFAPSPTGRLHLGHAFSALQGFEAAKNAGGKWLLRIEDIDHTRVREEYVEGIYEDLRWMGLDWSEPVLFQSTRQNAYDEALEKLQELGLIYGCECTRRDLALSAPHTPGAGYPGTCRDKHLKNGNLAWRLNAQKAQAVFDNLRYREIGQGRDQWINIGSIDDVVLARRDIGTSYHLAVVVDDAFQQITHVTRGRDLEMQTPIHVVLQHVLGLPTPIYNHHQLITDENGKRLAKRDHAREIRHYRENGNKFEELVFFQKN